MFFGVGGRVDFFGEGFILFELGVVEVCEGVEVGFLVEPDRAIGVFPFGVGFGGGVIEGADFGECFLGR